MRVRVLGSAAGGGCPQWNCACPVCRTGRPRLQDTVAVSAGGTSWWLINASPDIRAQILGFDALRPGPGARDTPVSGVLLTTAELDHTLGLLSLREAVRLTVFATPAVTEALDWPRRALSRYTDLDWRVLADDFEHDGLRIQRLTVGTKSPRYASTGDVSALRLTETRTGNSFVHATCLPAWTQAFDDFIRGADVVLLDGTFATENELTGTTGRPGTATSMGHLPIAESRRFLAGYPGTRFWFGHVNNTNPADAPDIAVDGLDVLRN